MAKVTIHVNAFDYEFQGYAEDEEDVFLNLEAVDFLNVAASYSQVTASTYDKPEPEDTSETEVEDEESD